MDRVGCTLSLLVVAIFSPSILWAQAGAIAGTVRDTTEAVLPGVTVEASSPALIEKVRTAVTDGEGLYKISDLRPGEYSVTFSLSGFQTVQRKGIRLLSGDTANVGAELGIGAVAETLIVSGAAPMVDVQSVTQHRVVTQESIESLPTGRGGTLNFTTLVPGTIAAQSGKPSGQEVGGNGYEPAAKAFIHGSKDNDWLYLFNGLKYPNLRSGNTANYVLNTGMFQEVVVNVGSHEAENLTSGVRTNIIPKEGGNSLRGSIFMTYTDKNLGQSNITPALARQGVGSLPSFDKMWEINPAGGGAFLKDKLWFYAAYRYNVTNDFVPGAYYAKNPTALVYEPDLSRPAIDDRRFQAEDIHLTWAATPRHKFGLYYHADQYRNFHRSVSATQTPEASAETGPPHEGLWNVTYTAPITTRLLVDVRWALARPVLVFNPHPGQSPDLIRVTDLGTGISSRAVTRQGGDFLSSNSHATLTYVTGSHSLKIGMQTQQGYQLLHNITNGGLDITLQTLNGVPRQITEFSTPNDPRENLDMELGLFAQERWTRNKLTTLAGLRFDYLNASVPAQVYPATRFLPERSFPAITDLPNWKDLSPRIGVVYDVFGDGKTAMKVSGGKYLLSQYLFMTSALNPVNSSINSTTRAWTDTNQNEVPDCDLANRSQNDECGPLNNPRFGQQSAVPTFDPAYQRGWGKRLFSWEIQTGVQHQLTSGISVGADYTRHWYGNFLVSDNLLVTPSDYSSFCITAPVDPRLPGGGGNQRCGFYDLNPDKVGFLQSVVVRPADQYGKVSDVYNGVDTNIRVQLPRGIILQGGTSTGRVVTDNCDVVGKVDNAGSSTYPNAIVSGVAGLNSGNVASPSLNFCRIQVPFQTQVKLSGVYPLPWWALQLGGVFQSNVGGSIQALYTVQGSQVQNLGRPLSAGASVVTVPLVDPATLFGDRVNQLDLRVARTFKVGRTKMQALLDLFNVLNSSAVLGYNNTYGANWQKPTAMMPGRFFKFGAMVTF